MHSAHAMILTENMFNNLRLQQQAIATTLWKTIKLDTTRAGANTFKLKRRIAELVKLLCRGYVAKPQFLNMVSNIANAIFPNRQNRLMEQTMSSILRGQHGLNLCHIMIHTRCHSLAQGPVVRLVFTTLPCILYLVVLLLGLFLRCASKNMRNMYNTAEHRAVVGNSAVCSTLAIIPVQSCAEHIAIARWHPSARS